MVDSPPFVETSLLTLAETTKDGKKEERENFLFFLPSDSILAKQGTQKKESRVTD